MKGGAGLDVLSVIHHGSAIYHPVHLPMRYDATFLAYQVSAATGFVSERYSVANKS